jgi:CRP-like cAMP-binding protein
MAVDVSSKNLWLGIADCSNCSLRSEHLFASLTEDALTRSRCPINNYRYQSGAVVYHAKDRAHDVYALRKGLIKLERYLPDGSQRVIRLIKSGDVFGIEALVGKNYAHHAVVLDKAEICKIPVDYIQGLAEQNPSLNKEIMCRWQAALDEADDWLTELLTGKSKQRVARLLLRLCDKDGVCSLLCREDIGALLSLTTETASRTIADFKRRGLLKEVSNSRYSCDQHGLTAISLG